MSLVFVSGAALFGWSVLTGASIVHVVYNWVYRLHGAEIGARVLQGRAWIDPPVTLSSDPS
ncbi:MAG TPA: hypothetical protein VMT85_12515 [Thermoanaerobaculia bacterium]|nr:hypothetical protein [Thermoanaerobaculia bacterium]